MATKKQKHAAALKKRERALAEIARTNQEVLLKEQARRDRRRKTVEIEKEKESKENDDRHKGILELNKIKEKEH